MSLCINPHCSHPDNLDELIECQSCGFDLLIEGNYKVIKLLKNDGGYGKIYEINDLLDNNSKILKILTKNDSKSIELFKTEFKILSELNHPGIPKAEEYFEFFPAQSQEPLYCIVMEKIIGKNLEEWLNNRNNQPIKERVAIRYLKELTLILQEIHNNNFFHRDIKPSNIMLKGDGRLVLIDFGIAKAIDDDYREQLKASNVTRAGTEGYAAIEQEMGKAVIQSDFCALGRTFVFLLTGQHPNDLGDNYRSPNTATNWDWRSETSNISDLFLDFIDRLMARSPKNRPADTQEILETIDNIKNDLYPDLATKLNSSQNHSSTSRQFKFVKTLGDISSRHSTPIYSIAISPDGTWLISGSQGGNVKIWSLKSNQVIYDFQAHSQTVTSVDISPNGNLFATGSLDYNNYSIKLWTFENNDDLDISILREIKTSPYAISTIHFHPDSKSLVSGGRDFKINIWNLENGTLINTLTNHSQEITSIAITKDGQKLISGSHDQKIVVDSEFNLEGHTTPVRSLAISPDNKTLFSGSNDGEIKVWNLDNGEFIDTLTEHEDAVFSLVLSPDGQTLFSGSKDKTIKIWDVNQLKVAGTLERHTDAITSIAISPDGKKLLSASMDKSIKLWEIEEKY